MAMKYLGETFDIHGGGMDLKFPHHENEIAQAESATRQVFAKYWLHNGLTRFNTKKISKSDPEFEKIMTSLQLSNLLSAHPPELLRFLILQSQYRSPIEFSDESLQSAKTGLSTVYRLFERLERVTGSDPYQNTLQIEKMRDVEVSPPGKAFMEQVMASRVRFLESMDDDFNTAGAIGVLFELAGMINRFIEETRLETKDEDPFRALTQAAGGTFVFLSRLLGLFVEPPAASDAGGDSLAPKLIDLLVDVRRMSREAKQYTIGDHIRDALSEMGIQNTLQIEKMRDVEVSPPGKAFMEQVMASRVRFLESMDDDFNTAGAIGVLFELAGMINRFIEETRLETKDEDPFRALTQAAGGTFVFLSI